MANKKIKRQTLPDNILQKIKTERFEPIQKLWVIVDAM